MSKELKFSLNKILRQIAEFCNKVKYLKNLMKWIRFDKMILENYKLSGYALIEEFECVPQSIK